MKSDVGIVLKIVMLFEFVFRLDSFNCHFAFKTHKL